MKRLLALAAFSAVLSAQTRPTMFPAVRGTREMIGAANNFEVEAGYRILTQGGNAVDAGVAAILTAAVTEQSRFGLGGEAPLMIKLAGKPVTVVSGAGWVPAKATMEFYKNRKPEPWENPGHMAEIPSDGIRAATIPGVFDGLILALRQFGTMSFEQVSAPAIEYAGGFPIGEEFAGFIKSTQSLLELWPASQKFFLPNGTPPARGEIFREPTLAKTLNELVEAERKTAGNREAKLTAVRDLFYKGSLAQRMASFSEQNGGLISYDDLKNYHAETDQPRSIMYRGYQIMKPGFWTQGPVLLQSLNLLEGYNLRDMRHNSPEYLHTVVEAAKLAFADRDRYYGDPKFSEIPEQILLSKDYAADRRKLIDPAHASMDSRPGDFGKRTQAPGVVAKVSSAGDQDTTCVNVVDRMGNVFSATPSGAWLPSVIAGDTGIPFGTRLPALLLTPGLPNTIQAGKRPRLTLSPTIILKDGQPVFVLSTPGGDNQDQALLQVILNLIDFGMTPQEAVEAPRFQTEHYYTTLGFHELIPGKLSLEGRISRTVADQLSSLGHKVAYSGDWSNTSAPTVIKISNGVLEGGADPRRGRFIFGR